VGLRLPLIPAGSGMPARYDGIVAGRMGLSYWFERLPDLCHWAGRGGLVLIYATASAGTELLRAPCPRFGEQALIPGSLAALDSGR
jgi:hypothetical protein